MKHLAAITLTFMILGIPSVGANGRGPCDQARLEVKHSMGRAKQIRRVDDLIRCATRRWHVPGGYTKAERIADCESHDYPWADNGHGDLGIFQVSGWSTRARLYLKRRWFPHHWVPRWQHARANVLVAVRWAHRADSWAAWACQ